MIDRLVAYFRDGLEKSKKMLGMEVETSFLSFSTDEPAQVEQTQGTFRALVKKGWQVLEQKGSLIASIQDAQGNTLLYELGRQNIELSTAPATAEALTTNARQVLDQLYYAAIKNGLHPNFEPMLYKDEDLLVIPDDRDANWLNLDGREALAPLAKISAVQFTIEIEQESVLHVLNRLGVNVDRFLADYPQDAVWREYVRTSRAGYHPLRYGGPLQFETPSSIYAANNQTYFDMSLKSYCGRLLEHDVVQGTKLVPHRDIENLDIPLFLRSVWWYFRLRRYGNSLCVEVRPLPRRRDELFDKQLAMVLDIINL